MSNSINSDRSSDRGDEFEESGLLLRGFLAIRRSFILFTAVVGVVLIAIGASPLVTDVFAGMFGIWGATALVCAGLGFLGLEALSRFDN